MANDMVIYKEKDLVRSWASDVRAAETGFMKTLVWSLEQFQNKNNAPLAQMVALVNGKALKGFKTLEGEKLAQYATPMRVVIHHALADTKLVIKDGVEKFKVGPQGGVNNDKLEALRMLAAQKITYRAEAFKKEFPKPVKETKEKDDAAIRAQFLKYCDKFALDNGLSKDTLRHMLDAKPTNEIAH